MAKKMREGNYNRFGTSKMPDGICFTFEGAKECECAIRVYDKRSKSGAGRGWEDLPVPEDFCIGAVRSVCISGLDERHCDYNYVIDGKVVVDPYARRIVGREKWADYSRRENGYEVRSGFDFAEYDWQGDRFPEVSGSDMVLYKLHVRGFTRDGSVRGRTKGSFAAITEQIPYFLELGVTTIELMPAYEFEELIPPKHEEQTMDFEGWAPQAVAGWQLMRKKEYEEKEKELPRVNCWGYGSGNYFAPKAGFASGKSPSTEFKEMVRALHKAGLECVMEMNFDGQTNPNFIVDVLRYWVKEYHVDGFHLLCSPVAVASVISDVLLRRSKIFAQDFPSPAWEQPVSYPHLYVYNDDFLYTSRRMVNHLDGSLNEYLNQQRKQHPNIGFVNYFSNNNGFTLADVFSYREKHNEANGEESADGIDWNYSANCGEEGSTRKKKIKEARTTRMKQAAASVLLAQGVPLIYAGDEFGNSQGGNNNAYCQDNKLGWVNWKQLTRHKDYFEYVKELLALRKCHPVIRKRTPMRLSDYEGRGLPDLSYHGAHAWSGEIYPSMQAVGLVYAGAYGGEKENLYIGWNFAQGESVLALPKMPEGKVWRLTFGCGAVSEENERIILPEECVAVLVTEALEQEPAVEKSADEAREQEEEAGEMRQWVSDEKGADMSQLSLEEGSIDMPQPLSQQTGEQMPGLMLKLENEKGNSDVKAVDAGAEC